MDTHINYKNVIYTINCNNYNTNDVNDIFTKYKKSVYSQLGEDGIIEYIFKIIKPNHNYYVEFGAWDGKHLSNTANLRINHNWTGLLLESNKLIVNNTKNKDLINLQCEMVTKDNINILFEKYKVPLDFDLLSIDIDSNDYYVWKNLTNYRPKIVIVETNPGIRNNLPLTVQENKSNIHRKGNKGNYFGANLHAFYNLALRKGYKLLTVDKWNAFFVINEEFEKFNIQEISKDTMINKYCIVSPYWAKRNNYKYGPYEWVNLEGVDN